MQRDWRGWLARGEALLEEEGRGLSCCPAVWLSRPHGRASRLTPSCLTDRWLLEPWREEEDAADGDPPELSGWPRLGFPKGLWHAMSSRVSRCSGCSRCCSWALPACLLACLPACLPARPPAAAGRLLWVQPSHGLGWGAVPIHNNVNFIALCALLPERKVGIKIPDTTISVLLLVPLFHPIPKPSSKRLHLRAYPTFLFALAVPSLASTTSPHHPSSPQHPRLQVKDFPRRHPP